MRTLNKFTRSALLGAALLAGLTAFAASAAAQGSDEIQEADRDFERGDYAKAAKKYDREIRRSPRQVSPEAYAQRARVFLIQGQEQAGVKWVKDVAKPVYPDDSSISEVEATLLWSLGKKENKRSLQKRAIEIADRVVKSRPEAFANQKIRGDWYYGKDPKRCANAYANYIKFRDAELSSGDLMPRIKLGHCFLQTKEAAKAAEQFEAVSQRFRNNRRAQLNASNGLCAAYVAAGNFDRAITKCEEVKRANAVDSKGSVFYNLGVAYLQKKQADRARLEGIRFIKKQPNKSKGYVLVGDAHFLRQEWADALSYYQSAQERSRLTPALAKRQGRTLIRMNQADRAIEMLELARQTNPGDLTLAEDLGSAYLDQKRPEDALGVVEPLIKQNKDEPGLQYVAGRAYYNSAGKDAKRLALAKQYFSRAYSKDKNDTSYRRALVITINRQAANAHRDKKLKVAENALREALEVAPRNNLTNKNLAVVALEKGDCDRAASYLKQLQKGSGAGRVVSQRLLARAYTCQRKPNLSEAVKLYASAEKLAQRARNTAMLAEIYTEWAPVIMRQRGSENLDDAVAKLEQAVRYAQTTGQKKLLEPARRNLSLALYKRGKRLFQAGKSEDALEDFDRATNFPALLRGTEEATFKFALALAYLDRGQASDANAVFRDLSKLAGKNKSLNPRQFMKAPYDKLGIPFFQAYAQYRTPGAASRRRAASSFTKMQRQASGKFATKVKDLIASSWQYIAADEYNGGKSSAASRSLATADKFATDRNSKRVIEHNRAVLNIGKAKARTFSAMSGDPPEALCNLGILYDRNGDYKKAFDAWVQARSRNARCSRLDDWISSKKRIFGY